MVDGESSSSSSSSNGSASDIAPRSTKRKKRKVTTQQEINNEIAEVLIDNDTSANVTNNNATACMDSQFVSLQTTL